MREIVMFVIEFTIKFAVSAFLGLAFMSWFLKQTRFGGLFAPSIDDRINKLKEKNEEIKR
jgi:hypothetical protein